MKKSLFIVIDKLETYTPLFEKIKAEAPFQTEIISYQRFLGEECKEQFGKLDPNDLFFAFETGLYGYEHREIGDSQRGVHIADEIRVAGAVDQVDLVVAHRGHPDVIIALGVVAVVWDLDGQVLDDPARGYVHNVHAVAATDRHADKLAVR